VYDGRPLEVEEPFQGFALAALSRRFRAGIGEERAGGVAHGDRLEVDRIPTAAMIGLS
jgi:hypothetical protein